MTPQPSHSGSLSGRDDFAKRVRGEITSEEYVRRLKERVHARFCSTCGAPCWHLKGTDVDTCRRGHHHLCGAER